MLSRIQALAILVVSFMLILLGSYMALNLPDMFFAATVDPPSMNLLFRLAFFIIPLSVVTFFAFFITLMASIQYQKKREPKWDYLASSSAKMGIVFGTFALITQALMSMGVRDSYWTWHPNETFLMVQWFIFAAYLSLRIGLSEENQRARLSAVLIIFGFAGQIITWLTGSYYFQNPIPLMRPLEIYPNDIFILGLMIAGHILLFFYLIWQDIKVKEFENYYRDRISELT